MAIQKIRKHQRKWKAIAAWRSRVLEHSVLHQLLYVQGNDYAKIWVHPWSGISVIGSSIPQPRGKTKQRILAALLDIYDHWKSQLDLLGKPYYLKIWLFDPRFSQSQVVCAIGDWIGYYDDVFFRPETEKRFPLEQFGPLQDRLAKLDWEYCWDEDCYDDDDLQTASDSGSPEALQRMQLHYENLLRKPHRTVKLEAQIGNISELYYFKKGSVWVGG